MKLTQEQLIQENIDAFPKMPVETVKSWTKSHQMFSHMILKNLQEAVDYYESLIKTLKTMDNNGLSEWNKENVVMFLWDDIDRAKSFVKTALNYTNLTPKDKTHT